MLIKEEKIRKLADYKLETQMKKLHGKSEVVTGIEFLPVEVLIPSAYAYVPVSNITQNMYKKNW